MVHQLVVFALTGVCQRTQSQSNEETIVHNCFFRGMRNGTFVEIGGLDGVVFSNTLMLDTCLAWTGVLVEGDRVNYDKLVKNVDILDRSVRAHYGAVCSDVKQNITFALGNQAVSGDWALMSDSFKRQWYHKRTQLITVPCKPMSAYLDGTAHVDFFSLDVEGAELEVLLTIDFTRITIDLFMIELDNHDLDKNWKVRRLLTNLGYVECPKAVRRSGLFLHRRRAEWISSCRKSCR